MANMIMQDDALLATILERLVEHLRPHDVYLFGSRARGDATGSSDYDLLVVVDHSDLPGHRRDREALHALRSIRAPVDVVVLTRDEFERVRHVRTSLPATVLREGKQLYAA